MSQVTVAPQNKVFFNVQVLENLEGRSLRALRPDDNGYYDVVLAMLDATSRNRAYYDVDSLIHQITGNDSVFNMMLTQGNLRGEYGHPDPKASLERIDSIMEDRVSHHIYKVWTGDRTNRGIPLYGKIKPTGPFGNLLESSLLNPKENTTFSLRCLMTQKAEPQHNRMYRFVKRLVTFDYVNMPGYMEASKWFAPGTESLSMENGFMVELKPESIFGNTGERIGLEKWTDRDLADLFGMQEFKIKELRGLYKSGTGTYFDEKGTKRSVVHSILK